MKYNKGDFLTVPNKRALRGLSPNLQVLFFWLCDHADDNMKSFPSRQTLANECGMGIKTLDRSMQKLAELGYVVKTTRTNKEEHLTNLYEVVIFDHKEGSAKLTPPKVASKMTPPRAKKDIENSTHLTQPINTSTNVLEAVASPVYGNSEINELFSYWLSATGLPIQSKVKFQRQACSSLIKQWKFEGVKRLIDGVVLSLGDQYAPRIGSFIDLRNKQNDLLVWGRKKEMNVNQKRTIKI